MSSHSANTETAHPLYEDERRAALEHLDDAWEEAATEGIAPECVAHAALFRALVEFVISFGEEATAAFAERLPERIKRGEFTVERSMH